MSSEVESRGRSGGASAAAAVIFLLPELLYLTYTAVLAVRALRSFIRGGGARNSAAEVALAGVAVVMLVGGVIPTMSVSAKVAVAAPPGVIVTAAAAAAAVVALMVVASFATVAIVASAVTVVRGCLAKEPAPHTPRS